MVRTVPQVFVVRLPSTAARPRRLGPLKPTNVACPAESLTNTRFCVITPPENVMAEEDAITTGPVQLVSCRTSDTRFPPEVVANPKSPAESPASCPKCCVALGPSRTPESTQLPPAARVDTCRAQLDVLQVREPQTASKLSHATAIAPFGANSAPSRFRCAPEAIVVAAEPQAPPAGRCTTAMLVTPAPWRVAPTPQARPSSPLPLLT